MTTAITRAHLDRFSKLDMVRLERRDHIFEAAWDAAEMARTMHDIYDATTDPATIALAYKLLRVTDACEKWLYIEEGRTTADDSGTTASDRIRGYLDGMTRDQLIRLDKTL